MMVSPKLRVLDLIAFNIIVNKYFNSLISDSALASFLDFGEKLMVVGCCSE